MDNFAAIYKILKILEKAMDCDEPDLSAISADDLGISKAKLYNLLEMMADEGYIKGLVILRNLNGKSVKFNNISITIKGLEYLNENKFMKKAYNKIKGITDLMS